MTEHESPLKPPSTGVKTSLHTTPLNKLHRLLGAKLVPFAGYEMPLQYAAGIVKEHLHVRSAAGLFDVSHMGQARLGGADFETVASALEMLVPGDILALKPGRLRYTQLLNADGGMIDDMMVTRDADGSGISIVVNASRKEVDLPYIAERLPTGVHLRSEPNLALLALQGPAAAAVLSRTLPGVEGLAFLASAPFSFKGHAVTVSRSGYTGEDGFEISVQADHAETLAQALLEQPEVLPIGLGARDTLRLEAGLCLYDQDMDETTSPIEAGLAFSIGKRRRQQGGFPGAIRIQRELSEGPSKMRVGLKLEGRSAARSHMPILGEGIRVGEVTSGAFTPTAAASIALGYVPTTVTRSGTHVAVEIRGAPVAASVVPLPFVPHRYVRQA